MIYSKSIKLLKLLQKGLTVPFDATGHMKFRNIEAEHEILLNLQSI